MTCFAEALTTARSTSTKRLSSRCAKTESGFGLESVRVLSSCQMRERKREPAPKVSWMMPSSLSLRQVSAKRWEFIRPWTRTKAHSQTWPGLAR